MTSTPLPSEMTIHIWKNRDEQGVINVVSRKIKGKRLAKLLELHPEYTGLSAQSIKEPVARIIFSVEE